MRVLCVVSAVMVLALLPAQQITRIATIDYVKILVYFERDSLTVQHYQQEKNTVQKRIQQLNSEIQKLEEQVKSAQGNTAMTNYYQRQLQSKRNYLDSYLRNQVQRLAYLQQRVLAQNKLAFELEKAVDLTARERGISLVLNKSDPSILWVSADIDLTAPVLQRLKKQMEVKEPELETLPPLEEEPPPPDAVPPNSSASSASPVPPTSPASKGANGGRQSSTGGADARYD